MWTTMSSSVFRQMTIISLEHKQSPATGAALQLSTKVSREADSWSDSNSSSSESSSYSTGEIAFSGDGDDSEEEPANEKTMVNMD